MDAWPLEKLPGAAVGAVRSAVDTVVADVVAAVVANGSTYAEILEGPEGLAIRMGIEQAIHAFLDAIEHGVRPSAEAAELWRRLGEAEFQSGRGLEEMRAAFRTGTRAAWRAAAQLAAGSGIQIQQVIMLADAIFVFSDELAGGVVEGYLRIQSDEAGELERRRRRLATLLLDPVGHDPSGEFTRRLGVQALVASDAEGMLVLVGDPEGPGRRGELSRAVGESLAVLGPTVPVADAARSLRRARLVLRLLERGALGGAGAGLGPVRADEHLAAAILLQDEELARELAQSRLEPLEALPAHERERLVETLAAWLGFQRQVPTIAAALHVHPQTVRYRMARLRDLLGDCLDSPEGRFELELALRARRALTP
jgi:hypothetical protein